MWRAILLLAFFGACVVDPLAYLESDRRACAKDSDCTAGYTCEDAICAQEDPGADGDVDPKIVDAGDPLRDAGRTGVLDAGVLDAGVLDAGVLDAGVLDAGIIDAGIIDAGILDAGVLDAGIIDAGDLDAGDANCLNEWHHPSATSRTRVDIASLATKTIPAGYPLRLHDAPLGGELRLVACDGPTRVDVNMRQEERDDQRVVYLFENPAELQIGEVRKLLLYGGLATPPPIGDLPAARSHQVTLIGPAEEPTLDRQVPAGHETLVLSSWLQSDDDNGNTGGLISLAVDNSTHNDLRNITRSQTGGAPGANGLFARLPPSSAVQDLELELREDDGNILNDDRDRMRNGHLITAVLPAGAYGQENVTSGTVGANNALVLGLDVPPGPPVLVLAHAMFFESANSASLSVVATGPGFNSVLVVSDQTTTRGRTNLMFAGVIDPTKITRLELINDANLSTTIHSARFQIINLDGFDVFEQTTGRSLSPAERSPIDLGVAAAPVPSEVLMLSDICADNESTDTAFLTYTLATNGTTLEEATESLVDSEDKSSAFMSRLEFDTDMNFTIVATPGNGNLEITSARATVLRFFEVNPTYGAIETQ